MAQGVVVNATVVGSIPTRKNKLFSFPRSGRYKAKRGVEFRHLTLNVS